MYTAFQKKKSSSLSWFTSKHCTDQVLYRLKFSRKTLKNLDVHDFTLLLAPFESKFNTTDCLKVRWNHHFCRMACFTYFARSSKIDSCWTNWSIWTQKVSKQSLIHLIQYFVFSRSIVKWTGFLFWKALYVNIDSSRWFLRSRNHWKLNSTSKLQKYLFTNKYSFPHKT